MASIKFESVVEDAVECSFFLPEDTSDLLKIQKELKRTVHRLTHDHIWHKDAFEVLIPINNSKFCDLPPCLYSLTCFGDNIEDEWLVVYIALEISKQFTNMIIQVKDNDGEFLLIEAAHELPSWCNPDNSENRVFIYNGDIHIIPPDIINLSGKVCMKRAISAIRIHAKQTKASRSIHESINKRIGNYNQKLMDNLHRAIVRLPINIAALLRIEKSLIAPIIHAYCAHDKFETKVCKKLNIENWIDYRVTFTKCLYAMLMHSKLIKSMQFMVPSPTTENYKKITLGIKIACGFEFLQHKVSQDKFSTSQWQKYLDNLKSSGYFRDNIEGSVTYTKLLKSAQQYYVMTECPYFYSKIGDNIERILQTDDFNMNCNLLKDNQNVLEEDSDDWLNIKPEQLDEMLTSQFGDKLKLTSNDVNPVAITQKLTTFFEESSDIDGIEIKNVTKSDDVEEKLDFDCNQFTDALKNILELAIPEDDWNLDSGTDLSEYGSDEEISFQNSSGDILSEMEKELEGRLVSGCYKKKCDDKSISKITYENLKQSVKEEKGSFGPSSMLLTTAGVNRISVGELDSDDDENIS